MNSHPASFGASFRQRRETINVSRSALGEAAGGISSTTIRRLELDESRPHRATLAALVRALRELEAAGDE